MHWLHLCLFSSGFLLCEVAAQETNVLIPNFKLTLPLLTLSVTKRPRDADTSAEADFLFSNVNEKQVRRCFQRFLFLFYQKYCVSANCHRCFAINASGFEPFCHPDLVHNML
ncbi:hypothetical protein JOB18_035968 [Solea senegalensis]|uniref:Uncharacterized protein n=1 Tax=Solea senegalensis TaxID=28829 RepID=A0AAV6SCB2_SOLSE|nr:hypothetical protein JOB18_035968 [Solea senegalensis]